MSKTHLGLILAVLSCAEPAITAPRQDVSVAAGQERSNSYSIGADHTIRVTFANVRGEGGEPIRVFVKRMLERADAAGVRRLVIDVRSIPGNDARLLVPLIKGIVTRDRFAQPGGLFVVVGPNSFSPAQNAARLLQHYANPIFVTATGRVVGPIGRELPGQLTAIP